MLCLSHESAHLLFFYRTSLYATILIFLKVTKLLVFERCFWKNIIKSLIKCLLFHSKVTYLLASKAKLYCDSVGCLQPSHITLIDAAWLDRRLSRHSVCSARGWRAPDLLLTVLILGVTLWINSTFTVENWIPPHLGGACQNSIWKEMGAGNLIISPKLGINLPAKHYSNQKHNLLNVCIHQPCHLLLILAFAYLSLVSWT